MSLTLTEVEILEQAVKHVRRDYETLVGSERREGASLEELLALYNEYATRTFSAALQDAADYRENFDRSISGISDV